MIWKAIIAFCLLASSAQAQTMCDTYEKLAGTLEGQYRESTTGKGLSGPIVIELFVGPETFTIIATQPTTGKACIIAAGKSWVAETPKIPGKDT